MSSTAVISPTWIERECRQCGVKFQARTSNVKRGRGKFCSRACHGVSERKNALPPVNFAGDRFHINGDGYYQSGRTKRMLHRVVWEMQNGPIPEGYRVYHRDKVRSNYAIGNLYLKEMNPQHGCRIEGCEKEIRARELCATHYEAMRGRERRIERRAT